MTVMEMFVAFGMMMVAYFFMTQMNQNNNQNNTGSSDKDLLARKPKKKHANKLQPRRSRKVSEEEDEEEEEPGEEQVPVSSAGGEVPTAQDRAARPKERIQPRRETRPTWKLLHKMTPSVNFNMNFRHEQTKQSDVLRKPSSRCRKSPRECRRARQCSRHCKDAWTKWFRTWTGSEGDEKPS